MSALHCPTHFCRSGPAILGTFLGGWKMCIRDRINVYINIDQKAAYYTVDGEGADNYRIDLTCL